MTLKFAIRNLRKRPFLNLIKIIGLSLALSSILLIVLFLKNELGFDYGDIPIPEGKNIGVVEDFHLSSIKRKIEPLATVSVKSWKASRKNPVESLRYE